MLPHTQTANWSASWQQLGAIRCPDVINTTFWNLNQASEWEENAIEQTLNEVQLTFHISHGFKIGKVYYLLITQSYGFGNTLERREDVDMTAPVWIRISHSCQTTGLFKMSEKQRVHKTCEKQGIRSRISSLNDVKPRCWWTKTLWAP